MRYIRYAILAILAVLLISVSLANRVLEAASPIDGRAPQWFLGACAAVREPQVFRQGAQGFIAAAGRSQSGMAKRRCNRFAIPSLQ